MPNWKQASVKSVKMMPDRNKPTITDFLKNSYSKTKQEKIGNYQYDKDLSTDNQQVYYNHSNNQLVYSVTGTHNIQDIGTDVALAMGNLKKTKRYKEADEGLKRAKEKYGVDNATVIGHSLGSAVGSGIASGKDKIYSYAKGSTIGQGTRQNEISLRTSGDAISQFEKGARTLTNRNSSTNPLKNILNAHRIDNLDYEKPIYVE